MNRACIRLLTAISLLATSIAFAAPKEEITIIKKPTGISVLEDTSEANRTEKSYLLTAQPIGFAVSPIPSVGINAGFYIDHNSLIEAQFSKGTLHYIFFDIEATTFEMTYKHFFSNSFYTRVGAAYRKILLSNAWFLFSNQTISEIGYVESLAADIAIGNQWQWNNFTLGCDWIGYMAPVSTLNKSFDAHGATGNDLKDLDKAWDNLANVGSFQFLRLYLGVSF